MFHRPRPFVLSIIMLLGKERTM